MIMDFLLITVLLILALIFVLVGLVFCAIYSYSKSAKSHELSSLEMAIRQAEREEANKGWRE